MNIEFWSKIIELLSDVAEVVILSAKKPLNFYPKAS